MEYIIVYFNNIYPIIQRVYPRKSDILTRIEKAPDSPDSPEESTAHFCDYGRKSAARLGRKNGKKRLYGQR